MAARKSEFVGKEVLLTASGFEYPLEGTITKVVTEPGDYKFYALRLGDCHIHVLPPKPKLLPIAPVLDLTHRLKPKTRRKKAAKSKKRRKGTSPPR